jgi:hydrogenase maturation protease
MNLTMRTMVLGLGNTIFKDDGVGIRVAAELKQLVNDKNITIQSTELAGMDMLETLSGYDRVIIIDAIQTGGSVGEIYRLTPESLTSTSHTGTPHDVNFSTGLEFGERIGVKLPSKIDILAIEIPTATAFGGTLTPDVEKAVPECVKMALGILKE